MRPIVGGVAIALAAILFTRALAGRRANAIDPFAALALLVTGSLLI